MNIKLYSYNLWNYLYPALMDEIPVDNYVTVTYEKHPDKNASGFAVNYEIIINKSYQRFLDETIDEEMRALYLCHTLCHEYRHIWQIENGWEFNFKKPHNERAHEIDANTFSLAFVGRHFHRIRQIINEIEGELKDAE